MLGKFVGPILSMLVRLVLFPIPIYTFSILWFEHFKIVLRYPTEKSAQGNAIERA